MITYSIIRSWEDRKNAMTWIILAGLLLFMPTFAQAQMQTMSLLHNPGPEKLGGWMLDDYGSIDPRGEIDDTFYLGSVGFGPNDYQSPITPSWRYSVAGGNGGMPSRRTHSIGLRSRGVEDPCSIREVALVYHRWQVNDGGRWSWKVKPDGTPFTIGDFDWLVAKVDIRLDDYSPARYDRPKACADFPVASAQIDLRLVYPDGMTDTIPWIITGQRYDVLSLHTWEMPGSMTGNPIMWEDGCRDGCVVGHLGSPGWSRAVSAGKLGLQQLRLGEWVSYTLDVKTWLGRLVPPPKGRSLNDAILVGFDIYVHCRGVDCGISWRGATVEGTTFGRRW